MLYFVWSDPLWQRLSLVLLVGTITGCSQLAPPAASQSEDSSNNPYAQFRQAVNEVEPLIDPNLESLTASQFQQESPATESSITLSAAPPLSIKENLTMVGAPTVQTFNEQMYQRLIQAGYGGVIDINTLRAGSAVQKFCQERSVSFLTVNRAMTVTEIQSCQGKGRQPLGLIIGKDPLLLVVNKQNDFVRGVNLENLKAMLTSRVWSEVNPSWPNVPIERGMIGPNSSTVALLTQKLFPTDGSALLNAPGTRFYDYPEPMVQDLSAKANGIALINASIRERFTQTFEPVPINGISASLETVESNAYPLVQPLFVYVDQNQLASGTSTKAVVSFYLTEMAEVMPEVGLLPLNKAQLDQTKRQWLNATGSSN